MRTWPCGLQAWKKLFLPQFQKLQHRFSKSTYPKVPNHTDGLTSAGWSHYTSFSSWPNDVMGILKNGEIFSSIGVREWVNVRKIPFLESWSVKMRKEVNALMDWIQHHRSEYRISSVQKLTTPLPRRTSDVLISYGMRINTYACICP